MKCRMLFCLWQMHLVILQRSRKTKLLQGFHNDSRISCWKWNYIRMKFNFMQVNLGNSAQYLQLSGYLGLNEAPSGTYAWKSDTRFLSSLVSMVFTVVSHGFWLMGSIHWVARPANCLDGLELHWLGTQITESEAGDGEHILKNHLRRNIIKCCCYSQVTSIIYTQCSATVKSEITIN